MQIDCATAKPRLLYEILTAAVSPRPIAWVSTMGADASHNLAPFSFYNVFSAVPPVLGFATGYAGPDKSPKDTLANIRANGEFVVNMVDSRLIAAMNETSANLPYGQSEFERAGLAMSPSRIVTPPRVAEVRIAFECHRRDIIDLGGSALILGDILSVYLADDLMSEEGRVRLSSEEMDTIGRLCGEDYLGLNGLMRLARPLN